MSEDAIVGDRAEEIDAAWRAWQEERNARAGQLSRDARAVLRALEGWPRVASEADWVRTVEKAGTPTGAAASWLSGLEPSATSTRS